MLILDHNHSEKEKRGQHLLCCNETHQGPHRQGSFLLVKNEHHGSVSRCLEAEMHSVFDGEWRMIKMAFYVEHVALALSNAKMSLITDSTCFHQGFTGF